VSAQRLGYQPALDGVRAVAIASVVLFHYPWRNRFLADNPMHGGFLGVDAFFVLSGFLITTLLLEEHERVGSVSLPYFYARRALRLLPALAVLLVIALVLCFTLAADDPARPQLAGLFGIAAYVANWVRIYRPSALGIVSDTWSLAIEEQFYLIWPLILVLLLRRRLRLRAIAVLTLIATLAAAAWRAWMWHHLLAGVRFDGFLAFTNRGIRTAAWNRIYFGSDTRADALLAGCFTAIVLCWLLPRHAERVRTFLGVAGVLGLVTAVAITSRAVAVESSWLPKWGFLAFAASIAVLVAGLVAAPRSPLARLFAFPALVWLGRRSYAIYLFHQLVFVYCNRSRVHLPAPLSFAFQITAVLVVAELSYRIVEAPMLRRKRAFESAAPVA
jgi:peptidoglycan/LPS O-acetylase OafA/YrhL